MAKDWLAMANSLDLLIASAACAAILLRWIAVSLELPPSTTLQIISIFAL